MSVLRAAARSASAALRPGEVHRAIAAALDRAGMDELWVAGTVAGLRVGQRFTSLELVEYEPGGSSVVEMLAVGMFARVLVLHQQGPTPRAVGWKDGRNARRSRRPRSAMYRSQV